MSEIIFQVIEDKVDGGYSATALGFGIHSEADTLEELRANIREAVLCHFEENVANVVRLHFVRDEVLAL